MIFRLLNMSILVSGCLCSGPQKSGAQSPSSPWDKEPIVNLAIWSNYITEGMIQEFTAKTGIKIQITNYSSNEELLAKLQAGATGYDVAVPSDYMVGAMVGLGLVEKIDRSKITNFSGLDPTFLNKDFDHQNEYSVPYDYTLTGIATNTALRSSVAQSWNDVFVNPSAAGKISLLDDVREALGAALKLNGYSLNSVNDAELAQAKSTLAAAKPRLKAFTSEPLEGLIQGEFAISHMYSSDALQARHQTQGKIQFAIPKEGATLAIDNLVIPKGAQHIEAAHQLIDYLISAKANLQVVEKLFLGPVVKDTRNLLPDALKNDPVLFPSPEVLQKCEMMYDLGESTTKYDRIWTEIKATAG